MNPAATVFLLQLSIFSDASVICAPLGFRESIFDLNLDLIRWKPV
jgi:hypothetical protein